MTILLDRINSATIINDKFSFEFSQWIANTIDTLNEIIAAIEPTLVSIDLTANTVSAVAVDVNSIFIPTNTSQTVYTLPITTSDDIGSTVEIDGFGSGGWKILTNGSTIKVGSVNGSAAISITSANRYDSIKIILVDATTWITVSSETTGFTIT